MITRRRAAGLVLPLFLLAACGTDSGESATADGPEQTTTSPVAGSSTQQSTEQPAEQSGGCAPTSGPSVAINTAGGEPEVRVPQPEGWERMTQMDSEMVRLSMVNRSLVRDGFAPNIVVTGETSPPDPQAGFDLQLRAVREGLGLTDVETTEGELCGHPTVRLDYSLPAAEGAPARAATGLLLAVSTDAGSYMYTFTAQAPEPADPAFDEAVATILEGVRVNG